jgi:hypothetical protein
MLLSPIEWPTHKKGVGRPTTRRSGRSLSAISCTMWLCCAAQLEAVRRTIERSCSPRAGVKVNIREGRSGHESQLGSGVIPCHVRHVGSALAHRGHWRLRCRSCLRNRPCFVWRAFPRLPRRNASEAEVNSRTPNNSLERTQPRRDFMYDVAMLRRSARGR